MAECPDPYEALQQALESSTWGVIVPEDPTATLHVRNARDCVRPGRGCRRSYPVRVPGWDPEAFVGGPEGPT